jgi:molybdate transport system ATP-binding protein
VLNVLPASQAAISSEQGPIVEVQLQIGQAMLLARITRKSLHELALREGQQVFALIKAVSLDRRSVGYA